MDTCELFDRGFNIDTFYLQDHMVKCIENQLEDNRDHCLFYKVKKIYMI